MARFCGKCGSPVDESTGRCSKCGQPAVMPRQSNVTQYTPGYNVEKQKAERAVQLAEQKAKKKEEKKRAWSEAKKRYKADVAGKKAVIKKAKKDKKKAKLAAMSAGQRAARVLTKLLMFILILALIAVGVFMGLRKLGLIPDKDGDVTSKSEASSEVSTDDPVESAGSVDVFDPPTDDMPEDYEADYPDADEYFGENAEVVYKTDAEKAGRTEAEAYKNLTDRGFTMAPITVNYTIDGTYIDETAISESGTDKHPIYTTYYVTEEGYAWIIYEINGDIFASPVSYNMEHSNRTPVMLSESETLTSYDSNTDKFYVTKPNESVLDVRVVDKISAETLDTLTEKEIRDL